MVHKKNKGLIQIIVPCFNEEAALNKFLPVMDDVIQGIESLGYQPEVILVDDGQKDRTLEILKEQSSKNKVYKYISFSRNFGKEAGIYAGLKHQTGDYIALLDADLQDPPELILEMIKILETKEFDCAATRRTNRVGEPPIRSWFAHKFYQIINKIQDADIVDGARDFRLMTREMVEAVLQITEHNRFSKGIFGWVGFKTKWIDFENRERIAGETKWSFWKLFKYAIDGIVDFSTTFLNIPIILSIVFGIVAVITLISGITLKNLVLVVIAVQLVQSSLITACLAAMQLYIKNIVQDTRNRPIYIIKESSFND